MTRLSPSSPAAVRRDSLGALRSGNRKLEIQQSHLLTLPAASTHGDQFIRAAEINLLDDYGLAKDGRTKWKRQILLERGLKRGRLLGFAVGVHRGLLDQCVEPTRARRPGAGWPSPPDGLSIRDSGLGHRRRHGGERQVET